MATDAEKSNLRYAGKVTIVTGGSKGIGEGVVREFGKNMTSKMYAKTVIGFLTLKVLYFTVNVFVGVVMRDVEKEKETLNITPCNFKTPLVQGNRHVTSLSGHGMPLHPSSLNLLLVEFSRQY